MCSHAAVLIQTDFLGSQTGDHYLTTLWFNYTATVHWRLKGGLSRRPLGRMLPKGGWCGQSIRILQLGPEVFDQ